MLRAVLAALAERPALREALDAARSRKPLRIGGLSGSHGAAVLSEIQAAVGRSLAVVVPAELDLEVLLLDLRAFHDARGLPGTVVAFPPRGVNPYGAVAPHDDVVRERLQTLDRCSRHRVDLVIAPLRAWMERLPAPAEFAERSLRLGPGAEIDLDELRRRLVESRYRLVSLVESLGEFAVRGGILDVFPPTREHPVRIEFFGDQVESLREFNPRDQRSMRLIDEIELPPASTRSVSLEDVAHGDETDDAMLTATLADYLDDPVWVELEPEVLDADGREWTQALDEHYHQALTSDPDAALPERLVVDRDAAVRRGGSNGGRIEVRELAGMGGADEIDLRAQAAPAYRGRLAELAEHLGRDLAAGERTAFLFERDGKAQRLAEILSGYDVPVEVSGDAETIGPGVAWIGPGRISAGFRVPDVGLWVGCDAEIFGRARPVGRSRRFHGDTFQADFRDLAPGDLVVHEEHGIGRFASVKQIDVDESVREFMEIEYRGADRLYVPLDQLYLVQKFRAGEDTKPKIDRLGSTSWRKVKSRVKQSLQEMASDLLELYAARKASYGHPFGEDTPWQRELEEGFEFEETPDQLTAIAEVKADMEAPEVMDRLLCGDVGYGKTEVAMRAAFKAIMDGKQVAMLAPTTVLAHQHWQTLRQRFAPFPVRVELLSRFRDRTEQKVTTDGLRGGDVDMVVGTHRLLSGDVQFKDLGLLIVDEEQRFGVRQKDRLKQLKREVDVLAMTATPIPRTLQMSLLGVRDLSVIETPPKDRYAIATHLVPYDAEIIAAAIREELGRGGQVFFVHNRVESIYRVAERVRELVPEASYRVAHGQLPKVELERVMLDFVEGEADVLVTTTIIENGLDIPLANTMIVNRADTFGLAQLYQLRGRVGRSTRRAFAYLIVPPPDVMSTVAKKRLRAIQEFSDLGSGFRLAAMDLEIRGAGSLLGERQHGQIAAVGFELYARLLEEAVKELRGEPTRADVRVQLNLGMDMQLPEDYIDDPVQRLMISKRLASARTVAQLDGLQEELRDRFGPLPVAVERLFAYAHVRLEAEELGIVSIDRQGDLLGFRIAADSRVDMQECLARVREHADWELAPPDRLLVRTGQRPPAELLESVRGVLEAIQ